MSGGGTVPRIPLQVSRGSVVASIQVELSAEVLAQFQQDLLQLLHSSGAANVILDVAGVDLMDADDFDSLRRSMAMARLMGARCLVAGLQPGVVAALVELGASVDDIEAALDLDAAFARLEKTRPNGDPAEGTAATPHGLDMTENLLPTFPNDEDDREESGRDPI
jgi:rsbT antagonist protein RsbS